MPPDPRVHVGVAAVVSRPALVGSPPGDLLLVQRGGSGEFASDGYGTWALPGGWLEFGEQPHDAAVREVEEETGVIVRPRRGDGFEAGVSDNGAFHIVTLFVICDYLGGAAMNREPDKALAVDWVPWESVVEMDLFAPLARWWDRARV